MPSYAYVNGDGLSVLDSATPNGATEQIAVVDDAIRQIKAYLKDPSVGPKALLDALTSEVDDLTTAVTDLTADVVALEDDNSDKVIVNRITNQSVSAGSGTQIIQFDHEEVDASLAFDPATFTFTAPRAGLYLVVVQIQVSKTASAAPTDIIHKLSIFVDAAEGASDTIEAGTDENDKVLKLTRMFDLSENQTLQMKYTLTVGSGTMTVDILGNPIQSIVQIARLAS